MLKNQNFFDLFQDNYRTNKVINTNILSLFGSKQKIKRKNVWNSTIKVLTIETLQYVIRPGTQYAQWSVGPSERTRCYRKNSDGLLQNARFGT